MSIALIIIGLSEAPQSGAINLHAVLGTGSELLDEGEQFPLAMRGRDITDRWIGVDGGRAEFGDRGRGKMLDNVRSRDVMPCDIVFGLELTVVLKLDELRENAKAGVEGFAQGCEIDGAVRAAQQEDEELTQL